MAEGGAMGVSAGPRILMAVYKFHPAVGGAERQCLALSRALRERGLDVDVATFRLRRTWPRHELVGGVPVTRLPRLVPAEANLAVWGAFFCANRSRYDVIHVHEANQAATAAAHCLRKVSGVPYIVKFVNSGPRFDLTLARQTKRWPLRSWILEGTLQANATIAITEGIGGEARDAGILPERVIRIPNGVSLAGETTREEKRDARQRLGIPPDRRVVLRVGTVNPKKGVPVLLEAWGRVIRERRDVLLVSVGGETVPESLRPGIESLGDTVRCVAQRPEGVDDYLRAADLFVLPSLVEGLSNALLEAQAAGLPCVVTRVGGNAEVVEDGVNGLVVEPGRPEELAGALLRMLDSADLRASMAAAARGRARDYDIRAVAGRYEELYRGLVEGREGM